MAARAAHRMTGVSGTPRVSVLVVCKDAARTIRRCVDSLVRQDHQNVHIVVQDGASTDGTLEILRSYGDRLDLVSEPDADQNEGFVRGLRRCTGDIVGFCWADEELLPGAASWAVEQLAPDPALGAVYGCFIETDLDGNGDRCVEYPPWDFARVFGYEFIPPVCASFFRGPALATTYLQMWDVAIECTEYVLWASVGSRYPVRYIAHPVAKYARHPEQLSMRPARVSAYPAKIVAAIDGLAARTDMPAVVRELRGRAAANVHLWAAQWLLQECGLSGESRRHLAEALRYAPDLGWLSTMVWNCARLLLARGEGGELLAWLTVLEERSVRIVGCDYARVIALRQLGHAEEADRAEPAVRNEPNPAALLQLVPDLVVALIGAGRTGEAEACLDVFWRIAQEAPRAYLGVCLVLTKLERFADARAAVDLLLRAFPDDQEARGIRMQLEIMECATWDSTGRRPARAFAEAMRIADVVWRAVREPEIMGKLSSSGEGLLTAAVSSMVPVARELGFADLEMQLRDLLANAAARPARPPAGDRVS